MKWTQSFLYTLRDDPSDAEIPSHKLLVRAGCIRKVSQGIHTYSPFGLRALRKLEQIIREELDRVGCIEFLMPMVQPKELWEETGRWKDMGDELVKLVDRGGKEHCLGGTHEEVITDFVRKDIKSYRDIPVVLYQIQTKFRNGLRPRFGLMRGREFLMKDAYSFDADKDSSLETYEKMANAYKKIFNRLGVDFRVVDADSGNIGGDQSQEFHVIAGSGEDQLLVSDQGDFAANAEICPAVDATKYKSTETQQKTMEEFSTPGLRTIEDLEKATGVPQCELVKTMFFNGTEEEGDLKPITVLLRGSDQVNPIKLKNLLGLNNPPPLLTDDEVKNLTGAAPGSCGPIGLKTPIYMDKGVEPLVNYIVGANKDDFHTKNVNHNRDFEVTQIADLRLAKAGDKNPKGEGLLKEYRGIEVGHIFYLGTKYSKDMGLNYLDKNGKSKVVEMGCYGLGVSRTVQAAVEQSHDDDGIIWPLSIAPYAVHICLLDPKDEEASGLSDKITEELESCGIDVFVDDRKERPGVKFKDADLLGMPLRLTIGGRGIKEGIVEFVERKTKNAEKVAIGEVIQKVKDWVDAHRS